MLKSARLSVLEAPPPSPVEASVPRPISTVSAVVSAVLSAVAVSAIVTDLAVVPDAGTGEDDLSGAAVQVGARHPRGQGRRAGKREVRVPRRRAGEGQRRGERFALPQAPAERQDDVLRASLGQVPGRAGQRHLRRVVVLHRHRSGGGAPHRVARSVGDGHRDRTVRLVRVIPVGRHVVGHGSGRRDRDRLAGALVRRDHEVGVGARPPRSGSRAGSRSAPDSPSP